MPDRHGQAFITIPSSCVGESCNLLVRICTCPQVMACVATFEVAPRQQRLLAFFACRLSGRISGSILFDFASCTIGHGQIRIRSNYIVICIDIYIYICIHWEKWISEVTVREKFETKVIDVMILGSTPPIPEFFFSPGRTPRARQCEHA